MHKEARISLPKSVTTAVATAHCCLFKNRSSSNKCPRRVSCIKQGALKGNHHQLKRSAADFNHFLGDARPSALTNPAEGDIAASPMPICLTDLKLTRSALRSSGVTRVHAAPAADTQRRWPKEPGKQFPRLAVQDAVADRLLFIPHRCREQLQKRPVIVRGSGPTRSARKSN